ncbi:pyridoxal phosphate-dependent aminotransferase [Solirubrobacter taibaiensis]|nr:pyridoxal phosphate-dependent aminotransferase [Solirubrobacter taibaiensis]
MSDVALADLGLGHLRIAEAYEGVPVSALGTEYGDPAGARLLREAVADWQGAEPDEVVITTGASLALVATLCSLPRPASILVPRPHYPAYAQVAAILGIEVLTYELQRSRGWQPCAESVAERVRPDTRAMVLNQPNNPTGSLVDLAVLRQLEELARASGLLVISDETYGELVFDGASVPDMHSIFERSALVRILSFSKRFGMPGERLGCVIAEPTRGVEISRAHWSLAMSPPATAQVIALSALRSRPDRHVGALVEALARNRDRAIEILAECDRLAFVPPVGGCFMWCEIVESPIDSTSFANRCRSSEGVNVTPGQAFGVDLPVFVRASFGVPGDELTTGLQRLVRAARNLDQVRFESRVPAVSAGGR